MENIEILENEREYGETREENFAFLSNHHLIHITNEWYLGVSPSVYVGKSIRIESFAKRPHNVGFETRDEAKEKLMDQGYNQRAIFHDNFVSMLLGYFEKPQPHDEVK